MGTIMDRTLADFSIRQSSFRIFQFVYIGLCCFCLWIRLLMGYVFSLL